MALRSKPSRGDRKTFLDPRVVSRLSRLDLAARLVVEGFITGLHKSPYHGFSVEFAQHRQYMPGDPIKNIDWKVYAKSDRFYVKEFEEETNLRAYIILDTSRSMTYRSEGSPMSKLEYGVNLAGALSYLMLGQQDAVGLLLFAEKISKYIAPRSVRSHLKTVFGELSGIEPGVGTDVSACLHQLAERVHKRGLVILISDLMDTPEKTMAGLKHFRHRKHEVIVFHLLDKAEIEFPFEKEGAFVDLESGEEIETQPWEIGSEYRRRLSEWTSFYRKMCGEHKIDYVLSNTSTPFDVALLQYLEKRQRLH
jgi:uncharacterized protein (DUF58 family)